MPEIQMAYMGSSQFKAFRRCEAAALAELEGRYATPKTSAILVGAYVDAYFEGTLEAFEAQNPELFKRDGALKAEYAHAEKIISRLEADELYMLLMSGQKQVVLTGEIAGVPYKIKIDSLLDADTCREIVERYPFASGAMGFCDGAIVDQKIMRDTADVWSDEEWGMGPLCQSMGLRHTGGHLSSSRGAYAAIYFGSRHQRGRAEPGRNLHPGSGIDREARGGQESVTTLSGDQTARNRAGELWDVPVLQKSEASGPNYRLQDGERACLTI